MRLIHKIASAVAVGVSCTILAFSQVTPVAQTNGANAGDAQVVKEFETSVKQYLDLRKNTAGKAPRPTNSPDKLTDKRSDMAQKVRSLRSQAKQGDIFTPDVTAYFRRQIEATLAGPQGQKIRASLRHAEPLPNLTVKVNQSYPEHVPLQSTPPTLLMNLPPLPKELEYRIVGSDVVLYDVAPNLVVDYIPNAIPKA